MCKERRDLDQDLKTQIRFGSKDLELYLKERGSEEGFRKTSLREFLGKEQLPKFDHSVRWRRKVNRSERRVPNYRKVRNDNTEEQVSENRGSRTSYD